VHFALNYAVPTHSVSAAPYVYDQERQLNILSDGTPAVVGSDTSLYSTTTSTAGSKTHFDD
jgi:putative ATP-grasp target RiPP